MSKSYMFEWCDQCDFRIGCYTGDGGPFFLEPDCGEGPGKKDESEVSDYAAD